MKDCTGPRAQLPNRLLSQPPPRYREMIVLRELEQCSYKEIATITSIPLGTVLFRVSRARRQLQLALADPTHNEVIHELYPHRQRSSGLLRERIGCPRYDRVRSMQSQVEISANLHSVSILSAVGDSAKIEIPENLL